MVHSRSEAVLEIARLKEVVRQKCFRCFCRQLQLHSKQTHTHLDFLRPCLF